MSRLALTGLGVVGRRAARQLVESPTVEHLVVAGTHPRHDADLAAALGLRAEPRRFRAGDDLPDGIDAIATALPGELDVAVARAAIDRGIPVACAADGAAALAALRELDGPARAAGVTVLAGCGFAPGLSEVLARHATTLYDHVDEVRIARAGWAGRASADSVRRERRDVPAIWRRNLWHESGSRVEQVWFPEPIGAVECASVRGASDLVLEVVPGVDAVTWLLADVAQSRFRRRADDAMGAVRVEVYGRRGGERDVTVYGALDRVSIAAGAVLALGALAVVTGHTPPGVHAFGAVIDPVETLRDLAHRGVRAAVFEGAPVT